MPVAGSGGGGPDDLLVLARCGGVALGARQLAHALSGRVPLCASAPPPAVPAAARPGGTARPPADRARVPRLAAPPQERVRRSAPRLALPDDPAAVVDREGRAVRTPERAEVE